MKRFNVLYQGRKIYTNLTAEDCSEILQDFSERFYSGEDINLESLELEEIYG
jgi:broad-specificity NMP kinase